MSTGGTPTREERFAVLSRKAVFLLAYALMAAAFAAFVLDRTALGVGLVVVTFLMVAVRALWTLRRGVRATAARRKAQVPAGPVTTPDAPSPVEQVVADLVALNSDDLPYRIDAGRTPDGVDVEVRWKSEEARWQSFLSRGDVTYAWRMNVSLDPATAHYRFTEHSAASSTRAAVSTGGVAAQGAWSWQKGKTALQLSMTVSEGPDGKVQVAKIQPADAKVPVFTVLRRHGWRPPRDWFGARLFER